MVISSHFFNLFVIVAILGIRYNEQFSFSDFRYQIYKSEGINANFLRGMGYGVDGVGIKATGGRLRAKGKEKGALWRQASINRRLPSVFAKVSDVGSRDPQRLQKP